MTLINTSVLMSDANNFSTEQPINPYYDEQPVNFDQAKKEHASIKAMLEQAGVTVTQVSSPTNSQDGVYTANWALIRGNKAVVARLPDARKAEEGYAAKALANLGKEVIRVPEGLKFSGQGDALPCGNYLFCGQGYRSSEPAQKFAADTLGFERIQLQTVPELDENGVLKVNASSGWNDSFFYDIDLALAVIKPVTDTEKGLIAYCPEAFTPESQLILAEFDKVDKIIISLQEAKEAFAANLVSTGQAVVMSATAPRLAAEFRVRGLQVFTPEITELAKGGGYIRCTTLTI